MTPFAVGFRTVSSLALVAFIAAGCGPSANTGDIELSDGIEAYRARRWGDAVSLLQRALEAQPEHAPARRLLAAALLHEGRLDDSEAEYLKAAAADSSHADVKIGLAEIAYHRNRLDEALRLFVETTALSSAPTSSVAAAWNGLAVIAREQRDNPLHRLYLLRALQADEKYAPALYNLGVHFLTSGVSREAALTCFERYADCVDLNDPHRARGVERARRLEKELQDEQLVAEPSAAGSPAAVSADLDAAYDELIAKKYEPAVRSFRKVLVKDACNFSAKLGLATALQRLGRKTEALSVYEEVLKLRPEHRDSYLDAATLAFALRKFDRAEKVLDRALSRWPQDGEVLRQLAKVYQATGRVPAARAYGSYALSLPGGADAAFESWLKAL